MRSTRIGTQGKRRNDVQLVDFVTSLDVSVNKLRNLKNVAEFLKLKRLVADHNALDSASLKEFPRILTLETLWVNDNNIDDLERFVSAAASSFPNMSHLSMLKNPCVPNPYADENTERYQQYRYYVISRLPNLTMLDTDPVTDAEREFVQSKTSEDIHLPSPVPQQVMSSFDKMVIGFHTIKEGELTLKTNLADFTEWDPFYFKLGEGKLVYYSSATHTKPAGIIELDGYTVTAVDDMEAQDSTPRGTDMFLLQHESPTRRAYILLGKDKAQTDEWVEAIMNEISGVNKVDAYEDWDAMEAKKQQLIEAQEGIRRQQSELRLKKTVNQTYGIDASEIKLMNVLGGGSYGSVHRATVREKTVAAKVFHHQEITPEAYDDFVNEVEILSKIHHPHVIMFMGASFNPLMIVTDLMQGDLEHLLLDRSVHLSLLTRLEMAKDAALGLNWLHCSTPMIIHRDVKTSNFLYDENLRIVVSDFGFAEYLRPGASTWDESGSFKGTLYYVAPEMLKNSEFNEKSDVYSFGIVLWMIYTRQEVYQELEAEYHDLNEHAFDAKVKQLVCFENYRPAIPEGCPILLKKLIEDCWDGDDKRRPSFGQIISRLDEAIYAEAIPDAVARQRWISDFPACERVKVSDVFAKFAPYFQFENELDKVLVTSLITSSQGNARRGSWRNEIGLVVTPESFGRFLEYFGPLSESHDIVSNARRVVTQKWFFGELSAHEAHARLVNQEIGTFLVRMSPNGGYVISYVASRTSIRHHKVRRDVSFGRNSDTFSVDFFLDKDGESSSYFALESCVRRQTFLKEACPGSPFSRITEKTTMRWKGREGDTNTPPNSPPRNQSPATSRRAAFAEKRALTIGTGM